MNRSYIDLIIFLKFFYSRRDLKTDNLLLDIMANIKLADFGLAVKFKPEDKLELNCGTLWYKAPEMLEKKKHDGHKIDIWSLGIILYELVTGYLPFDDTNRAEIPKKIIAGKFR